MRNGIGVLGAAVVLAVMSVVDVAQSEPQPVEQVTRHGAYVVKKAFKTEPYSLTKTITQVSLDVDYKGLDLTSNADVARLESRVRQAAEAICGELAQRHPRSIYTPADEEKTCAKNASESALANVRATVATARAQPAEASKNR